MDLKYADDRYLNDAKFHSIVKQMESLIYNLEFTPSEVREAAIYACLRVEIRRAPKPINLSPELKEYIKKERK